MNRSARALQIASLVDLTSLSGTETQDSLAALCAQASGAWGHVAALCVFPVHVPFVRWRLDQQGLSHVPVATVVNFPGGELPAAVVAHDIESALAAGAAEIDLVFPYKAFAEGQVAAVRDFMRLCRQSCAAPLKVILESGVLADDTLRRACLLAVDNGADFLKTSTGRAAVHATPHAARIMLRVIAEHGGKTGFKASGGLRTLDDALVYLDLAEELLGAGWVGPDSFRFGASGLLAQVLSCVAGEEKQ